MSKLKINLDDLLEALEFQTDRSESVVNIKTGKILYIDHDLISDDPDAPEWMQEIQDEYSDYFNNESDYINIPSKNEIHEYRMMEDFAFSLENKNNSEKILIALKGTGAFKRFNQIISLLNIEEEWFKFRDLRYKQIALDWCDENGFEAV